MSLVRTLQVRSNASDCNEWCKCLGEKFSGKKRVALVKGLLVALEKKLSEEHKL